MSKKYVDTFWEVLSHNMAEWETGEHQPHNVWMILSSAAILKSIRLSGIEKIPDDKEALLKKLNLALVAQRKELAPPIRSHLNSSPMSMIVKGMYMDKDNDYHFVNFCSLRDEFEMVKRFVQEDLEPIENKLPPEFISCVEPFYPTRWSTIANVIRHHTGKHDMTVVWGRDQMIKLQEISGSGDNTIFACEDFWWHNINPYKTCLVPDRFRETILEEIKTECISSAHSALFFSHLNRCDICMDIWTGMDLREEIGATYRRIECAICGRTFFFDESVARLSTNIFGKAVAGHPGKMPSECCKCGGCKGEVCEDQL